eukprot:9475784-Prorocentrum_lima.AAC.1
MTSSLVGSEMCIRDSAWGVLSPGKSDDEEWCSPVVKGPSVERMVAKVGACLLYTSDAADDM